MVGRVVTALVLLTALVAAQDYAYEPDAAWLAHATEKWLVWLPDDKGASLDPPAKKDEEETEAEEDEGDLKFRKPKSLPDLRDLTMLQRAYVLQSVADPKRRHKVVVEWKIGQDRPVVRPVTVRDDGALVLTVLNRNYVYLHWPDQEPVRVPCLARSKSAVLVAAYPDGVVLQAPRPDDLERPRPGDLGARFKDAVLYWVPWSRYGLDSDKAQKMSYGKGVSTMFRLRVARFEDRIAMPGGVYSLSRKRRKTFQGKTQVSIYAFDGRVALGSQFSHSVRRKDGCGMVRDHEYFLARDGVGYWLEEGNRGLWTIKACRLRDRQIVLSLGHVPFRGKLSPPRAVEASTLAHTDSSSKTRFSIYWDKKGLRWTGEDGWTSSAWLKDADFK
ncbi:MAG: hypothetical protein ACYS0K_07875 [Planctomycetota bacterium]|jgi:hypothetical protein